MNRKLGKLLRPGMGMYFVVMAAFCAAALLERYFWLAAAETAVTLVVFMLYVMNRNRRDRQIQRYIQTVSNTLEATSQGESPLPAVLIRLGDGVIIWANHRFSELTGYADTYCLSLSLLLAFAMLYPEVQVLLFFVIPIQVKYFGWFAAALWALSFLGSGMMGKLNDLLCMLNFVVFFGPQAWRSVRAWVRREQWKRKNRR